MQDVIEQLVSAGLVVDPPLDTSGTLVRVPVEGDRHRKRSGWYVLHELRTVEGRVLHFGCYGNWKTGELQKIKFSRAGISDAERRRVSDQVKRDRELAEQARAELAATAAKRAARLWDSLPIEGRSPYLQRKKVSAFGLRFARDGVIVVPVRLASGELVGLQFIAPDGTKKFLTGTAKRGALHLIGELGPGVPLVIAEGYATAASVHQATRWAVAVAFDAGNLLPVAEALRKRFPDVPIMLAADDDHATPGNPGHAKAQACAERVQGVVALPVFQDGHVDGCTDYNDLHCREGLDAVRTSLESALRATSAKPPAPRNGARQSDAFADAWQEELRRARTGEVKADIYNVVQILGNDPRWRGVLGYCEFSYRVVKRKRPPFRDGEVGEWTDQDTTRLRVWLQATWQFTPKTGDTDEAVRMAAEAYRFHPVREYLQGLAWDGVPRIDLWLAAYMEAPSTGYTAAVGRYWLIAAVARVMRPPVKADCVMILEGMQGLGKSTALKILGGEWYSDTHFQLGEKDGYSQMCGVWICELSELDSFNKAESTRAKQFFGSQEDRYRPPYGRRAATFARQCVFAGTTNQDSYLKDPTGNRRYWPVPCLQLDAEALARDRDQLWAEAMEQYQLGSRWWPGDNEGHHFRDEQEKRFAADSWEDILREHLLGSTIEFYTVAELAKEALKMDAHQLRPPEEQRIGRVMARLGWIKGRHRVLRGGSNLRLWVYQRPTGWSAAELA